MQWFWPAREKEEEIESGRKKGGARERGALKIFDKVTEVDEDEGDDDAWRN